MPPPNPSKTLSTSICRCKPAVGGSQGQAHGHLALAAGSLRKQKVGYIGAGNGEYQQSDHRERSQKDQQRVLRSRGGSEPACTKRKGLSLSVSG